MVFHVAILDMTGLSLEVDHLNYELRVRGCNLMIRNLVVINNINFMMSTPADGIYHDAMTVEMGRKEKQIIWLYMTLYDM